MGVFCAFTCFIFASFVASTTRAVSIQRFYPYGGQYGDSQLSKFNHEAYSQEISLRVPIKFYSDPYNSLFVHSNGLISFITAIPQFGNMQFPLDYPVIAAFYANTDIRSSGSVYYRETDDVTLLNRASQEIRQFFPNSGSRFQATSLFIATWFRVGYYNQKNDKVNTYQIVIASNQEESYVKFLYADEGIQWIQGDGQLGTGLPDAKAQAGLVGANGRAYTLPGSGTDQIRNLMRLSNTNEAGVWIFKIGPHNNSTNIEVPDNSQIVSDLTNWGDQITTCAIGYSRCHSQATCVDTPKGFCCTCRSGFYGNGFNCLKDGVPLRANGKINIDVNGIKLTNLEIQAYIVIQDGRAYTAISKVPSTIGTQLQLLYPITTMLNWLFAKPIGNGLNGFQITGGVLNHTAEIFYKENNERVSVSQRYFGLDVTDQLRLEATVIGTAPQDKRDNTLTVNDYQQQFNFVSKGLFRSSSTLTYNKHILSNAQDEQYEISLDQTIHFNESCLLNSDNVTAGNDPNQRPQYSYYRVKTARNFISYESRENILRFAATSKVSLLTENADPCIEGRVKCVANSSCIVEGDSFRCVCNPGFHTTYSSYQTNEFGCLDVNECAEGKANCDPNAICINEIGSYQCACKSGYTGNGYYCTALETESPCVKNPSLCSPPNSKCTDKNDPRTCHCLPGFQKQYLNDQQNGFVCSDVNECEYDSGSICGVNSICVNYPGSYSCSCQEGYSQDREGICQRKDASCDRLRNCSPNGECIYNETSAKFLCNCIRGYYGDGYTCQSTGGRHVVQKVCTSGVCVCPSNYIAYDNYCIGNEFIPPEKNLSCNTIRNMCHPQAQCVYNTTASNFQCICNAGFEGNGLECEASCLRNNFCDEHASCVEVNGKAQCVCQTHYQGDGIHCIHSGMCNSDSDCEENEECAYNEVSVTYECKCKTGYAKSQNSTCLPISRCPQCHPYARCVVDQYTQDSKCVCVSGYRGDGVYHCEQAPLSCNVTNFCSPYANCLYNVTYDKFQCQCKQGYTGNGTHCQRIINCAVQPDMCDINARCTSKQYGVYNCECNAGFVGNGSYCTGLEKIEGGFLLVNYGMGTVRLPLQGDPGSVRPYSIQLQADQIAIGLAIDCFEGKVYWSDYNGRKIKYSNYKGKNIATLVDKDIENPEGLTIDWISRKLYWTDAKKKSIQSMNLDGTQRQTIISTGLNNPRGIAVHPYKRKLFWTDWYRAQPKIEWSNLDGSARSVFLSGIDVQVPNSIAIDWSTDEVCWADAGTKRISCSGIDNKIQRLITTNVSSPFGLTVSNDKYFWTDWTTGKVGYYDRYTSRTDSVSLQVGNSKLYGIAAVPNNCP